MPDGTVKVIEPLDHAVTFTGTTPSHTWPETVPKAVPAICTADFRFPEEGVNGK